MPFRSHSNANAVLRSSNVEDSEESLEFKIKELKFDSLKDLIQIEIKSTNQNILSYHDRNHLSQSRPQLLIGHDFKGGYNDVPSTESRNYTFEWFSNINQFVYFSHHRVTIPPPDWISAAHTHHSSILGTLIFEHQESVPEIELLLRGPDSPSPDLKTTYFLNPRPPYNTISTYFADRLIDLAIQHAFQGWLLNFEASISKITAQALRLWVEYLRLEGERRIGKSWEICWYDSVSHQDGKLKWRSTLDKFDNLPFYAASSSIFLDYHWTLDRPRETVELLDSLQVPQNSTTSSINLTRHPLISFATKQQTQLQNLKTNVYFGVDVFGRGCPYGGGFSSWKATSIVIEQGLSVALFAPGWTWESHHLHPARKQGWKSWWAEERYQWCGLPTPDDEVLENTYVDACRIANETGQKTLPVRGTSFSEIPAHRPILSLFPPSSDSNRRPRSFFYTNYSLGSGGNGYWLDGLQVMGTGLSWTDMASCFPKPDLIIGGGQRISCINPFLRIAGPPVRCEMIEHVGWHGSGSVLIQDEIKNHHQEASFIWINTLSVSLTSEQMECRVMWRAEDESKGHGPLGVALDVNSLDTTSKRPPIKSSYKIDPSGSPIVLVGSIDAINISSVTITKLGNGWHESTCLITGDNCVLARFGISIPSGFTFNHILGSLSISPLSQSQQSIKASYNDKFQILSWTHFNPHTLIYVLFLNNDTFLGTIRDAFISISSGRQYAVKLSDLLKQDKIGGSSKVVLKAVDQTGRVSVVATVSISSEGKLNV
ncbi:hypothetical protein CROQUDRAFT_725387 [Cronartium quercuum f. sp. fusiforme G11]|uniref:Cytosolic endo-beta-N-acetylglucosaminidase TIM barrel domain-containing protein n=1 Tax=Cronartium quercuum f. sp. fusiforme G11 TaxID=708437 RepID=A0A9P6NE09_9BASI|nr:hypothetical protein CROQUDRAFT_725387 [Cronartium quercuum f. sp. fusiforme G11]